MELTPLILQALDAAGPEGLSRPELREALGNPEPDTLGKAVRQAVADKAVVMEDFEGDTFYYLARFSEATPVMPAVHPMTERHCGTCTCSQGVPTDRELARTQLRILRALECGPLTPRALGQKFSGAERRRVGPALALLVELGRVERTPEGAWVAVR